MNKIIEKIIGFLTGLVLKIFGGSPRRYWAFAVGFLFLALIGIFALDGLIFWRMNFSAFRKIYVSPEPQIEKINPEVLAETAAMLKAREAVFNKILSAPALQDPSR